jgi:hypothetical protein
VVDGSAAGADAINCDFNLFAMFDDILISLQCFSRQRVGAYAK